MAKTYKKEAQQNQVFVARATQQNQALATKGKTLTKDTHKRATKAAKNPSRKQTSDSDKTAEVTMHAISESNIAEFESESEQQSDQEQIHINILLNMDSYNEWLDSPLQVYSVTISECQPSADFLIENQELKTKSMFDTGAQTSCISYDCYREFTSITKIDMNVEYKVTSANESNLVPIGVVICLLKPDTCEFEHKVILSKHLLCPVILGLDFAQDFRVGIDRNNWGQLYLHQDHKPLMYSKPSSSKDCTIISVKFNEDIDKQNKHNLTPQTKEVGVTKSTQSLNILGIKDKIANVIANTFLCIESPSLCIIPTVCIYPQKRGEVNKMLLFVVNVGHEEVKIIKGHTLAFLSLAQYDSLPDTEENNEESEIANISTVT